MSDRPLPRRGGSGRFRTARPRRCSARIHERADDDYLLLQEHPHVYTLGSSADLAHVLRDPASVGAELVQADRGGDVTYHGPGQLVGYPIVSLAEWRAGQRDVVAYVRRLEVGARSRCSPTSASRPSRVAGYTGVWVGDEKIAAIGVRVARGPHPARLRAQRRPRPHDVRPHRAVRHPRRGRHVDGAAARRARPTMRAVVDRVVARFAEAFGYAEVERQDVAWRESRRRPRRRSRAGHERRGAPVRLLGRLAEAGVDSASTRSRGAPSG